MLQIVQVSTRGQVTIPVCLRKQFGLKAKRQVLFWSKTGVEEIVIKPLGSLDLSKLRGSVKAKTRPENWGKIRKEVKNKIAQSIISGT